MRTLVTVAVLALLIAGCGDRDRAKHEALRNEVIAFRVASANAQPATIMVAYQKLETAIAVAKADGASFDPEITVKLDQLAASAQRARAKMDADAAFELAAQARMLEILMTEAH